MTRPRRSLSRSPARSLRRSLSRSFPRSVPRGLLLASLWLLDLPGVGADGAAPSTRTPGVVDLPGAGADGAAASTPQLPAQQAAPQGPPAHGPPAQGPPLLDFSVSWIGNTFSGGDAGWVPQDVQDIFVAPDGTVYTTVVWEEHRGNIAAFRDGRLLQQTAHWKRGGIDRLVGDTIAANRTHIFFATGKTGPGDHDGKVAGTSLARRDRADIAGRGSERRVEVGARIHGVAASEDRVYAACADGRVRAFDAELKPLGDWPAPSPGEMALDARGNLWIIDTRERAVRRLDPRGEPLPQEVRFPDGVDPADVAVTPDGRLLVADRGPRRQVRVYRDIDRAPELERTLGEPGGVFAGDRPGAFGDRRFIAPIGVGGDERGNLYVACGPYGGTHGGTAIIQSYAPDGRLNWRVLSTEWLDTVDVDRGPGRTVDRAVDRSGGADPPGVVDPSGVTDPSGLAGDALVLYGSKYRYALDLTRPAGRQDSLEAITLHPDRYPDDPRLRSAALGGVWHRRLGGRGYLFFPDMNGGNLHVFRFDPEREGEIAVFSARIGTKDLWVDQDGDGRVDPGETAPNPTGETRGWFVDEDGTVWQATLRGGIFEYPPEEILPGGVPVYGPATRRSHPMPAPLTELRRIVHDRAGGALYLGGSTAGARAEHWKPMGPNLVRYDGPGGERRVAWHAVLPHEKGKGGHESYEPFDFAVEGDHVFVAYAGRLPSRDWPTGTVLVLARSDGSSIGRLQPSGTRTGPVPMDALQDMVHSLNVFRRPGGEYLVFIEDDGYTKNVLYRWKP